LWSTDSGEGATSFGSSKNTSRQTVVVDIHPRGRTGLKKHILLVLKSHQPMQWKVRTMGMRGTLDVIVSPYNLSVSFINFSRI